MKKLLAIGLMITAITATFFFIPARSEAVQDPGGGQMALCYTCDAESDFEGFGGEYFFSAGASPILDGKCAKQPGPTAPCDIQAVSCLWEVTGTVVTPPGWGLIYVTNDGLSGGIHVTGSGGDFTLGGLLVAPCGQYATITFTIVNQGGGTMGMHTLSVGCDACPG